MPAWADRATDEAGSFERVIAVSPKTILVHLTDRTSAERLLRVAFSIVGTSGAHITGLVVVPPAVYLPAGTPGQADPVIVDAPRADAVAFAAAIAPSFSAAVAAANCTGDLVVADDAETSAAQALVAHAAAADLVIVNQVAGGWSPIEQMQAPDSVALECGRPVLIVPAGIASGAFGTRVLLAWDGGREAARAMFDALPLLRSAARVRVIWVAPATDPYLPYGLQLTDVLAMLARHGVEVEERTELHPRGSVGAALLDEAERFGADLLVMGCYGHSRLREFVLGGATRHVLEQASISVLMSH